jgi:hypothetical protein
MYATRPREADSVQCPPAGRKSTKGVLSRNGKAGAVEQEV